VDYSRCLFAWNPTTPNLQIFHISHPGKQKKDIINNQKHLLMASDIHMKQPPFYLDVAKKTKHQITISKNPGVL